MRYLRAGALGVWLGLTAAGVHGEERLPARVFSPIQPVATLGRPVAALGRPVPATSWGFASDTPAVTDANVAPASYRVADLAPPQPACLATPVALTAPAAAPSNPAEPAEFRAQAQDPCCRRTIVWFSAEYLLWWFKDSPVPVPLATSGSLTDPIPGAIGQPGTRVLIGARDYEEQEHNGGRFTLGFWFDCDHHIGIEANYFFLADHKVGQIIGTDGSASTPALFVPFANQTPGLATNLQLALPFALPFGVPGTAQFSLTSEMEGAELNGIFNVYCCNGLRADVLGGFRWLELKEKLTFGVTSPAILGPVGISATDQFDTQNDFYGLQVGIRGEYDFGCWFANATAKVALGDMHETADVNGSGAVTIGGATIGIPGGIFAQPTNIGHYSRDQFAVVPEFDVNLGYQITDWARVFVGYSFLYVSNVARPGSQMDPGINLFRTAAAAAIGLPATGPARPAFSFHDTNFWAQGVNLGVEFRY